MAELESGCTSKRADLSHHGNWVVPGKRSAASLGLLEPTMIPVDSILMDLAANHIQRMVHRLNNTGHESCKERPGWDWASELDMDWH